MKTDPTRQRLCPQCARPLRVVWVHGHGQCAACSFVLAPCCDGETADARARPPTQKGSGE